MLWNRQHVYSDFNLLVLTFQVSVCKWLYQCLQLFFIDSASPRSSINVSIFFSIERRRPPTCKATGTKLSTSFSTTRNPLKSCPCFLRSHPHPLILSESWLLSHWERHLRIEILSKEAVYSGLHLTLTPLWRPGRTVLSLTHSHCP